uniref:hypothetical protein n=1 Tax=Sphingobium ummariense TaxID=420994 RepID=UPI001F3787AA|nr:hypothetical protein [Sphingobium ummariense]
MSRPSRSPFRYFNSSPEVIRLVVLMYVRYPLSLRNVEDVLLERDIDICHETAADQPHEGLSSVSGHASGACSARRRSNGMATSAETMSRSRGCGLKSLRTSASHVVLTTVRP